MRWRPLKRYAIRLPMKHVSKMPDWVKQQSGLRPGQKGYGPKLSLIHRYAKELNARGERVTHERIREMLRALGRNYRMSTSEITMGLRRLHMNGVVERYSNGKRVQVNRKLYRSIRAAAAAEGCAIETVRKRIRAGRPGWRYVD